MLSCSCKLIQDFFGESDFILFKLIPIILCGSESYYTTPNDLFFWGSFDITTQNFPGSQKWPSSDEILIPLSDRILEPQSTLNNLSLWKLSQTESILTDSILWSAVAYYANFTSNLFRRGHLLIDLFGNPILDPQSTLLELNTWTTLNDQSLWKLLYTMPTLGLVSCEGVANWAHTYQGSLLKWSHILPTLTDWSLGKWSHNCPAHCTHTAQTSKYSTQNNWWYLKNCK